MLRRRSPHWKRFALASALRFRSFFAEGEMIELTPDLKPLIEQWVTLTPSQKQAVLIMVKEMNNLKAWLKNCLWMMCWIHPGKYRIQMRLTVRRILSIFVFKNFIDILLRCAYNNSTRQATACVCQSVEIRECAGTHCLMELSGGVVQRNLKPA